jgi:hypothetical protein
LPSRVSPGLTDTADSSWLETTLTGPAVVEFTAAISIGNIKQHLYCLICEHMALLDKISVE